MNQSLKYTKEELQDMAQKFLFILHDGDFRARLVIDFLAQTFNTHPQLVWDKIIDISKGKFENV